MEQGRGAFTGESHRVGNSSSGTFASPLSSLGRRVDDSHFSTDSHGTSREEGPLSTFCDVVALVAPPLNSPWSSSHRAHGYYPYFHLLNHPNPKQRKTYTKYNRYLSPNPIQIGMRGKLQNEDFLPSICQGHVVVTLADEEGNPLPPEEAAILRSKSGELVEPLNSHNIANFVLMITEASGGKLFRLLFTVYFVAQMPDGSRWNGQEFVYSNIFHVDTNQRSKIKKPVLRALKPAYGRSDEYTSVWIKGKDFSTSVVVLFGELEGVVYETDENLLVVEAPPLKITETTTVEVSVFNKAPFTDELEEAKTTLSFTYRVL